eukprot:4581036-Heterocapsa_arctica.AAC.1
MSLAVVPRIPGPRVLPIPVVVLVVGAPLLSLVHGLAMFLVPPLIAAVRGPARTCVHTVRLLGVGATDLGARDVLGFRPRNSFVAD